MKVNDFLKKQKIKKVYAYHEMKQDKNTTAFGWVLSKALDLNNPVVVSAVSKSRKISDNDRKWSVKEGNSAASVSDYRRYFEALTGETPSSFLSKWSDSQDELEEIRRRSNERYREGEGEFLLGLANLLDTGKKFVKFGRIYKIIDPNT
jgi:hypothetical protein